MDAIGLNPIKLDAIGLDPIRMNAIRLGVPGASSGSGRPYIDPELLSHVKMAISTWGKSNDDPDRAVLKDLTPNGNDMRLLNFGFAGNSGYGLYKTNFLDYITNDTIVRTYNKIVVTGVNIYLDWWIAGIKSSSIPSYKVKISGTTKVNPLRYRYYDNSGSERFLILPEDGVYTLPADTAPEGEVFQYGFLLTYRYDEELLKATIGLTIEQLPDFEGWLCTDGVDDIIESVKPVSEMLEGSNEITVVSIIHQISLRGISDIPLTNYIRESNIGYVRNELRVSLNKTGIYGYTCFNIQSPISSNSSVINNILGDKEDYRLGTYGKISNAKLSVQGFIDSSGAIIDTSQVAYAGGFIANKVLTTDEINQIIAYFNLDRPGQIIKPQLYCNIKKQGITNDNHAEFNDQLIDLVGGHNIQLNNVVWEGESGIGSYPVVFGANKTWYSLTMEKYEYTLNPNIIHLTHINTAIALQYTYLKNDGVISSINREASAFKLKVTGLNNNIYVYYRYLATSDATTISMYNIKEDGIYDIPKSYKVTNAMTLPTVFTSLGIGNTDGVFEHDCNLTLEILPTIENALCLDGISDFGKATGLPVLKDYTVVADREWLESKGSAKDGGIVSKSGSVNNGAFILEQYVDNTNNASTTWTFGKSNKVTNENYAKRELIYQSKYSYLNNDIVAGDDIDVESMWLGTIRDNSAQYSKIAIRSLMLFPYSLSEFLLERQLRKYKAGTLYPDMIEFRPIVKSNIPYLRILYFITSTGGQVIKGSYIPIGSVIQINIQTVNATDEISSVSVNGKEVDMYNKDETFWRYRFKVTKSPQKISIVISSYLTMLGNDTFISNETLIKNE